MKKVMAVLLLVLALGFVSGCAPENPRTERNVRRIQRRDRAIQAGLEALPEDIETLLLTDEPQSLSRWDH